MLIRTIVVCRSKTKHRKNLIKAGMSVSDVDVGVLQLDSYHGQVYLKSYLANSVHGRFLISFFVRSHVFLCVLSVVLCFVHSLSGAESNQIK